MTKIQLNIKANDLATVNHCDLIARLEICTACMYVAHIITASQTSHIII